VRPVTLAAGTRLGPYEILAAIGAGGMGEVYRAHDARLKRDVAVKVLPAAFSADQNRLRRFQQEAEAAGRLNHPNILAIFDLGTHEGSPYLVSELLEGETLRERLSAAALPPRKAIEIAQGIASGLAAAHEQRIVHRDLKPENLFLTRDGRLKILDFGLAKLTQPEAAAPEQQGSVAAATAAPTAAQMTEPGAVLGTFGYMSREQVRGMAADPRSDLFAFGSILHEMLTGQRAFKGATAADTMSAILREDPPPLATPERPMPPALERIVLHCLEKNPEQRFQSARDIAFSLGALSGVSSADGRSTVAPAAHASHARRRWVAPVAMAVMAAAVGLAAYFAGVRSARDVARVEEVSFRQVTFRQEVIYAAAFAPDGRTIVYSGARSGNVPMLYSITPEYPEARPLELPAAQLLAISSKGEIALLTKPRYVRHRLCEGTLARMPLGSGAPRELLEGVRQADWAPDGSALAIIRDVGGKDRLEYPIGTVLYEASGYLSDLRFSPRGDRIAFFAHPVRYDDRGSVDVVDLAGKHAVLSEGYWGAEGLAWSLDGKEVLFSAGTGYTSFVIYGVTLGGARRIVLQSAGGLTLHAVAPDGKWLVTRDDQRWGMMALAPGETVERELSWLDLSEAIRLSADGRKLLFSEESSAAGPNYAVCVRGTDGAPVVRLGEGKAIDLSADGRWALGAIPTAPDQLMLYPTGAGEARRLDRGELEVYRTGEWFPDGKRILICGHERGGAQRCYVRDIDGAGVRAVTPEGAADGRITADGSSVLAMTDSGEFFLYPVAGGEPRRVPGLGSGDRIAQLTADGRFAYVFRETEVPSRFERIDLASGRREVLRQVAPADSAGVLNVTNLTLSADGRAYAYSYYRYLSQLFVVDGAR